MRRAAAVGWRYKASRLRPSEWAEPAFLVFHHQRAASLTISARSGSA
ncbi:MAG TPA: hypothetical protein PLD80_09690 [Rugosibacter sp.]|nr:hypothetical protein [Rugosibacter sp.]HPB91766.1 hypothetical protein [Rugosibacter sp.]